MGFHGSGMATQSVVSVRYSASNFADSARRVELVRPVDPAAINDHHNVFAGFAERRHDLMEILAQLLGIKVGHDFIEDTRRPILDSAKDTE